MARFSISRIVSFRDHEIGHIQALIAITALQAWAWLPAWVVGLWAAINLAFVGYFRWLSGRLATAADGSPAPVRQPRPAWVCLAGFLFTASYASVAVLVGLAGGYGATLTAAAFFAGLTVGSVSLFTVSRPLGWSAMAGLSVALLAGAGWSLSEPHGPGAPSTWYRNLAAASAVLMFMLYAVQTGFARRAADRRTSRLILRAEKSERDAVKANQAKVAFLAMVGHEIRSHLNGLIAVMHLAPETGGRKEFDRRAMLLERVSQDMLQMLNDLLDLSRMDAGKLALESIYFDIEDTFNIIEFSFSGILKNKGVGFETRITPAARAIYVGDPYRVQQILHNLVSNAVKFTAEGRVSLQADYSDRLLRLKVSDTGEGIPPANMSHLFEHFAQADASVARRHGGSGLGLSICRELCALMAGTIAVESTERGTTFSVDLPLERVDLAADELMTS